MSESNVVFITNKSDRHAYDSALKHGAITFLTSGNYPMFKTSRLAEEITEGLARSKPTDYLLFSGGAAIAAVALAIWLEMHGVCKALMWDQGTYIKRDIVKSDLRIGIERVKDRLKEAKNA